MTHDDNRSILRNTKAAKSSAQSAIGLTAAMVALLAGAPAGFAQSTSDEPDPGAGIGSLMNFLGGRNADSGAQKGAGAQPGGEMGNQPDAQQEFRTDGVYYDENMTVELHVQDEELTNVLQMLSIQSERNIVASSDVSARVTANLYGVTFHEALDAILHVNGYGYIEKGNFIYVYPIEVLTQIEEASRQREAKVLRLSFLNATDAADFVAPLLSEGGEIKSNGKISAWSDPTVPTGNEEFANESTLIIYDYPENIEAIGKLIKELDTRPAQILVEATIVQTALNEANAFGVDFSIIADLDFAEFGTPLGVPDSLIRGKDGSTRVPADGGGSAFSSTAGDTSGPGTFKAGVVSNDVAVFLRMLDSVTDTTIISNPKVVTLNRQPGRVLVGRKVGYLQTTTSQTSTTQSVEFLDTGTQLNFRPFVTADGIIRMELKPQVSEASLRSATDASGAAVTIPDEVTNELTANVMVPDGHTVVLGGLFRESTTASRRQVPILGDIPILGTAFRGHDDDVQRQEIIFLITPSIVSDQVLVDQGLRGEDAVRRVRAGAREGTLPFSRSRQAAQLLVEAEHLEADGNTQEALHKVRRALKMSPNQTDAIEVRERLLNEKDVWPTSSLLVEIIRSDAEKVQHNILEHGWWGATSKAENGEDQGTQADAGNTPGAAGKTNGNPTAKPGAKAANASAQTAPQFNPVVVNETDVHEATVNLADDAESQAWWNSDEFKQFMSTWDAEVAREQNRTATGSDQWWTSSDFVNFLKAYEAAVKADSQTGTSTTGAATTTHANNTTASASSSKSTAGKTQLTKTQLAKIKAATEASKTQAARTEAARARAAQAHAAQTHAAQTHDIQTNDVQSQDTQIEDSSTTANVDDQSASATTGSSTGTGTTGQTTPTDTQVNQVETANADTSGAATDDRVQLYEDNPYVYFPAEDAPEGFSPEGFEQAVTEMEQGSPSAVDAYLAYLRDAGADESYTEVPEDPEH